MCIPFYYFIPKSILSRCGVELNAIPRNPQELFHNRTACEFVESDLFRLLIIDATAFMVWPYMGFGEYMEIYSGYDPAWRFAHCPDYWIQELTDEGILASAGELFKGCHSELGYVPEWQIDIYLPQNVEETAVAQELVADYHFLQEHGIHTTADLQANIEQSKAELSALERERSGISNRIRRPKSPEEQVQNKERRKVVSGQMKPVREHLRRAERILEKSPHLYELLKQEHELEKKARARHKERGR